VSPIKMSKSDRVASRMVLLVVQRVDPTL
jgi:hypothetical protein